MWDLFQRFKPFFLCADLASALNLTLDLSVKKSSVTGCNLQMS